MFDPDLWLRQQLWERLWKGPGAVSTLLVDCYTASLCWAVGARFNGPSEPKFVDPVDHYPAGRFADFE
jgi:hypothetical protein